MGSDMQRMRCIGEISCNGEITEHFPIFMGQGRWWKCSKCGNYSKKELMYQERTSIYKVDVAFEVVGYFPYQPTKEDLIRWLRYLQKTEPEEYDVSYHLSVLTGSPKGYPKLKNGAIFESDPVLGSIEQVKVWYGTKSDQLNG